MSTYEKAAMIARQFAYVLIIVNDIVSRGDILIDTDAGEVLIHPDDSNRG